MSVRAQQDRSVLNWHLNNWDLEGVAKVAAGADVALVGVNSVSGEMYITVDGNIGDRNNLSAWHNGDEVINTVAKHNNNTVVVVHSVGPMTMDWIGHENITAVVWAGLPGQESGNALVDILYGAYNPSARLPYTIAAKDEDYPAHIEYVSTNDPPETDVNYTEGLFIDYRHFLQEKIAPMFGFGFGLSYTTFDISNVQVSEVHGKRGDDHDDEEEEKPAGVKIGRLMSHDLHRKRWKVCADVANTGPVNGCEVPQLYLVYPEGSGEPPRVLRDFDRVNLDPGASTTVEFELSRYDLSVWDVVRQDYVVPDGEFGVVVAKHAFDEDAPAASFCPGKC
jgi:beta-glucosidase